jgi:VIT1/CCC1 family predicted Fe2+/Mn2+ transporter
MQIPISRNEGAHHGRHSPAASTALRPSTSKEPARQARHHGRTVAAWTGSVIALVAFIVGAIAVLLPNWPLFWVSVGLAVVAIIVTVVLQRMGYGAH